jgi:hypothetical protein
VAAASETVKGRKSALSHGLALPPPSPGAAPGFPVTDAAHWDKAFQAVGRAGSPERRAALGKLLRKTAGRFGKSSKVPGSWLASGSSHSNTGPAMEFAMPTARRLPVSSPSDLIVSRDPQGGAKIRHRNGGMEIATLRSTERGWIATLDGRELAPHTHQRGALAEAIGTWNRGSGTPQHRPAAAGEPLQPAPRQTPLMEAYGIPAVRALATPMNGSSDGPRTTTADSPGSSDGPSGLTAKGMQIYKKLKAKGFPDARAISFAKRAQSFGGANSS